MICVIVCSVHYKNKMYYAVAALIRYDDRVFVSARMVIIDAKTMLVVGSWTAIAGVGMDGGVACMA
jgi:hypothetical protein